MDSAQRNSAFSDEDTVWNSDIPMIRITYKGAERSKVMRAAGVFSKVAFTAQKYNVPAYVEVKKGESLVETIVVGTIGTAALIFFGSALKQMGSRFGDDAYTHLKEEYWHLITSAKNANNKPEAREAAEEISSHLKKKKEKLDKEQFKKRQEKEITKNAKPDAFNNLMILQSEEIEDPMKIETNKAWERMEFG